MNTPIYDYLKDFIDKDITRFFMPGHKGTMQIQNQRIAKTNTSFPDILEDIAKFDITEITGADSLFFAESIIKESEENTSAIYGTKCTCFSTGGSTLCIQTMLSLACKPKDKIIASRNAHISFINTCSLMNLQPCWVLPKYFDEFGVSGIVSPNDIREAILQNPDATAVYITSPDYFGAISDIKEIARICFEYRKLLLVDNAHGANFKFFKEDIHPITLGADMCCDSAHKTLPVLTGGAYLHVSKTCHIKTINRDDVKYKMGLFGSTSPSYLTLLSLDLANVYLDKYGKDEFIDLQIKTLSLWRTLSSLNFVPISAQFDPTKITLDAHKVGMTGYDLQNFFAKHDIEPEYVSYRHVVLMLSPFNTEVDFKRLKNALDDLTTIASKEQVRDEAIEFKLPKVAMLPQEACFSEFENVSLDDAIGKTAHKTLIKCPPGVPIVVNGEEIDENVQKLLKKSSILFLDVLK